MSKIRITLFNTVTDKANTGLDIIEDRLVGTNIEFAQGPSKEHKGPIRIDTLLDSSEEAEKLIVYLQKLIGQLPITSKERKQTLKLNKPLEADSIKTLIQEAFTKNKNQEDLIDYLRGLNFAFLTYDHLKDICEANEWPFVLKKTTVVNHGMGKAKKKTIHKDYQFMVRILKLAKNPANDKIDPQIFFGFKLIGDKRPKVLIYELGIYKDTKELHWKEGAEIGFKVKEKFYKFPEPMSYLERSKWRSENRKLVFDAHKGTDKAYTPSAFYEKWKPYVTILRDQRPKKKK